MREAKVMGKTILLLSLLILAAACVSLTPPAFSQEFPHIEARKTITPSKAAQGSNVEITITLRGAGGMILTPVDVALVMDRSGSMQGTKIEDAKKAAKAFLNYNDERDRVALISYSSDLKVGELVYMNEEGKNTLKASIDAMRAWGSTDIYDALVAAMDLLLASPRSNAPPVIVLLSDGLHNWPTLLPDSAFQALAADAKNQGVIIYTIGLGGDADHNRLRLIAETTGASYYFAPTSDQLQAIYEEIARKLSFAGTNIEITETIPPYMTYNNDASKPPASQTGDGGLILKWKLGHLKVGEEWEVTYTARAGLAVESNDQTIQTKVEYITAEAASAIINLPPGLIYHDIRVSNFTVEPPVVYQGELVNITVSLVNQGLIQDRVELRTVYDDTVLDTRTVTLGAGESKTIEFNWNTSGVEGSVEGTKYNVTVIADPEATIWETNREDNQMTRELEVKVLPENVWWIIIVFIIVTIITVGGITYAKMRPAEVSYNCPSCGGALRYDRVRREWYCTRCGRRYRTRT
ncbi:MAG: VWA domain-containing protein [Candidatus Bathyarchaeia archaeon]